MKNLRYYLCILLFGFLFTAVKAQDANEESLGLPGDNLNLYAVMKLFQDSETLEGFEKSLNDENNHINNLDLDGDGNIDYIKVEDNIDGDVHTIVLKIAVTPHENQDVAVFTVQRDANNQVQIQLIGDEELYGKDYIVEPYYDGDINADEGLTPNPGYTGNMQNQGGRTIVVHRTTYVEVAAWPLIHFIFLPSYVVWNSPWYYGYYPPSWRPWHPFFWHEYFGYQHHYYNYYYGHYRHVNHYRYAHWNDHYYNNRRSHSEVVYQRRQAGDYKTTYSRPDTRKEGSDLFRRTHPVNSNRPGNRPTPRPGLNKPSERPGSVNPSARPGTTRPSVRTEHSKPAVRQEMNKPATRSGINRSVSPRKGVNKPATRHERNIPAAKPDRNKRSSNQDDSGSKTDKDRGRR